VLDLECHIDRRFLFIAFLPFGGQTSLRICSPMERPDLSNGFLFFFKVSRFRKKLTRQENTLIIIIEMAQLTTRTKPSFDLSLRASKAR
jgi:hypothetical protein